MSYHKARPTTYAGVQMRSRLEAEFASFCDKHGVPWRYEPHCYANATGQYLPDFWVMDGKGEIKTEKYLEIKPQGADVEAALKRMHIILDTLPDAHLVVVQPKGEWADGRYPGFGPAARCSTEQPCGRCHRAPALRKDLMAALNGVPNFLNHHTHLCCPWCGDNYTHFVKADQYEGGLNDVRPAVRLRFNCEACGSDFDLDVSNYKGYTVAGYTLVNSERQEFAATGAQMARAALAASRARKGNPDPPPARPKPSNRWPSVRRGQDG